MLSLICNSKRRGTAQNTSSFWNEDTQGKMVKIALKYERKEGIMGHKELRLEEHDGKYHREA